MVSQGMESDYLGSDLSSTAGTCVTLAAYLIIRRCSVLISKMRAVIMTLTKNISLGSSCTGPSSEPGHLVFFITGQTWS